jgi:4a-hydroxytetrahydrobiopterin dehydratase
MARDPLTDLDIAAALDELPGWTYAGDRLKRTITAATFRDAIALVNAVADVAEELDHHPDIDVRYRDVTFTCWTHTAGGVTTSDLDLARRIEAIG